MKIVINVCYDCIVGALPINNNGIIHGPRQPAVEAWKKLSHSPQSWCRHINPRKIDS
jgi:hypothetical protein